MRWWPFKRSSKRPQSSGSPVERAARELADRSRRGEQNATAQIVVLGEKYRARERLSPSDRARIESSYEAVRRYLAAHPVEHERRTATGISLPQPGESYQLSAAGHQPELTREATAALADVAGFGCDGPGMSALASLPSLGGLPGVTCAIVVLAFGPPMTPDAFLRAKASLPEGGPQESFQRSADDPFSPPADHFGFAGFVLSRAARLQAVQRGAPFALLGETMAWELGETGETGLPGDRASRRLPEPGARNRLRDAIRAQREAEAAAAHARALYEETSR